MTTQESLVIALNERKLFLATFYFGRLCKENGWRGVGGGSAFMAIVPQHLEKTQ
jgi:hypothetical protein